MRRPALGLALASLLVLAACGGSHPTIASDELSRLVLRQRDLGAPFSAFYAGRQTRLDNEGTPRSDPTRNGRVGGWIARFHRPGTAATRGPLVVESRADLFRDAGGAKKDLDAYRSLLAAEPGAQRRPLALPKIGEGTLGTTFVQPGAKPLRFYRIAWRFRNATASVTVEGFDGKLSSSDAVRLAQKQQNLLEAA